MSQILDRKEMSISTEGKQRGLLLRVDNLCVNFEKSSGLLGREKTLVRAVDHVSFDLFEGEIFSLVGESGSGKSTIAKCLTKLILPNSGHIIFDSDEVTALKSGKALKEYKRNVQIVYQDPFESLNPRWDVFTSISIPVRLLMGERNSETVKEIVGKVIAEVGLDSSAVMHKFPHQLSGGERQRVNIARALACNPRLLIADEPITMLDASQRINILSLLSKLKRERNLTVLLITHDLASAKLMSDRTAIMLRGRIVESGFTHTVLSKPHHPYTQLILETIPKRNRVLGGSSQYASAAEEVALLVVCLGCAASSLPRYVKMWIRS